MFQTISANMKFPELRPPLVFSTDFFELKELLSDLVAEVPETITYRQSKHKYCTEYKYRSSKEDDDPKWVTLTLGDSFFTLNTHSFRSGRVIIDTILPLIRVVYSGARVRVDTTVSVLGCADVFVIYDMNTKGCFAKCDAWPESDDEFDAWSDDEC